jgi:uncharacterized protein YdaU (DUF1376 family)
MARRAKHQLAAMSAFGWLCEKGGHGMNYYEHHLGDYAKDTVHLTMTEHGAYRLLLDRYYSTEQGIPKDKAHRVAQARTKDEKAAVDAVLEEFFTLADGIYRHARCDSEIEKAQVKIKAAQENGRRGGRPKRERSGYQNETQEKPSGLFSGYQNETQDKAHQSPITNHQTPDIEIPLVESSILVNHAQARGDDESPSSPHEWLDFFHDEHGVDIDHRSVHDRKKFWPLASAWVAAGVTKGQMREAVAHAHAEATEPIAFLPAYVDRVLAGMRAKKKKQSDESFRERDARLAAERAAEWSPSIAKAVPIPGRQLGQVIDGDVVEVKTNLLGVA